MRKSRRPYCRHRQTAGSKLSTSYAYLPGSHWHHPLHHPRASKRIILDVEGTEFDVIEFFRRIGESGARALLIGRRALVALGLPVLTADYDFWVHPEDIALFNATALPFGLVPSQPITYNDEIAGSDPSAFRCTAIILAAVALPGAVVPTPAMF